MKRPIITLFVNDPMGKRWQSNVEAAGRAEREFNAQTVVIKKPSREYHQMKEPLPCPSVLVNGRIIARNDMITYQGLRAAIQGEIDWWRRSIVPSLRKETAMPKEIVLFLSTTPYSFENTHTILKLADAALKKGQKVRLIASSDGVFSIVKGQVPRSLAALEDLVGRGMRVDIWTGCMQTRGLAGDDSVEGGSMSNLKGLFNVVKTEPIFLNFGV